MPSHPCRAATVFFVLAVIASRLYPATSGELKKEYDRWVRRTWTTENGLPQDTVYALAQASDGCLWIGSEGGLARFDGSAFTLHRKSTTPGLASDSITSLAPAADGALWIGSFGGGLVRQRHGRFTRIAGLTDDRVWALHRDRQGVLWVVPAAGAVYCLEAAGSPAQAIIDNLPDSRVTAVAGSEKEVLWIGTRGGLVAIRQGRQTVFTSRDGLAGDYVYCLFMDSRGCLWVGTTSGLSRIDAAGVRSFSTADGLADSMVRAIGEDARGRLWIGTDRGLTVMEPGAPVRCATPEGLNGDAVMAILRDREDGMWLGLASSGLAYLRQNEVRVHGPADGLSGQQISALCEDPAGRLWVGTRSQGLNRLENGNWRSYSVRDGLAGVSISSLLGGGGRLWIGMLDAGLQVMAGDIFLPGDPRPLAAGQGVLSLLADRQDGLWVGGNGSGLDLLQNGAWQHHGPARGLKGAVITALAQDRQGNIWAGSARDGLHVLRRGRWSRYTTADGLAGDTVYAIYVDALEGIWLGTQAGLSLYRQGRFTAFRRAAEPLNRTILAILADNGGRLWWSSPTGIYSARRAELLAEASAPAGVGVHCRFFGEMSGLKSTVCTGGSQPSACRGQDGRLWFPTQKGLVEIDPRQFATLPPPPLPRIERVQANGVSAPLAGGARFAAGTERFDFHYAAAAFSDPTQTEFSTRLDGLDQAWTPASRERSRHIPGVPAGRYAFRVRVRGQGGQWNAGEAVFRFTVARRFRQTIWFYLLLFFSAGSLAAGLLAYNRRKTRRRLEEKYRSSPLGREQAVAIAVRLEKAMEQERLFLDPELTLVKLAAALAIPAKHLSQVINEHFTLNFNDFVNRCRIDEAKRRLLAPAARECKLLRIAFESGFNSKSVFNAAFKKHTGLSPSEFRRLMNPGDRGGAE